jgi:hypothetical protein
VLHPSVCSVLAPACICCAILFYSPSGSPIGPVLYCLLPFHSVFFNPHVLLAGLFLHACKAMFTALRLQKIQRKMREKNEGG